MQLRMKTNKATKGSANLQVSSRRAGFGRMDQRPDPEPNLAARDSRPSLAGSESPEPMLARCRLEAEFSLICTECLSCIQHHPISLVTPVLVCFS